MNIKGLDYNTQRSALVMPEYGREIQQMVEHAIKLPTRRLRQICANSIIKMMLTKVPHLRANGNYEQTLWDHLYIISQKRLDINWPYNMAEAEKLKAAPARMPLPSRRTPIRLRHYGRLVEETLRRLKDMPDCPARTEVAVKVAQQMKRDLTSWGHGSMSDERVCNDIAKMTDGRITVKPEQMRRQQPQQNNHEPYRKRKKK